MGIFIIKSALNMSFYEFYNHTLILFEIWHFVAI